MSAPLLTTTPTLATYADLKARVRETLVLGQQRIEAARVLTYWRTGWLIRTHLTLQGSRAEHYGTQVVERLSRELHVDATTLRRCVQFAERLPQLFAPEKEIRAAWRKSLPAGEQAADPEKVPLTWSHYRALLIRLGGADWRREKLRLRGIDCQELSTPAGVAAKRFVDAQVQRAARVMITTTKPDQWDRYLSDVFLTTAAGEEIFLNNRLLETGHARRYEAVSPEDWESG